MPSARQLKRQWIAQWSSMLQYRGNLFMWLFAEAMSPLVAGMVWYAVVAHAKTGVASQDILTYYVMLIVLNNLVTTADGYFFAQEIMDGTLAQALVRPFPVLEKYVVRTLTEKSFYLLLSVPIITILLIVFPHVLSPTIVQPAHLFLFIPSAILAMSLYFILDVVMGSFAFWVEDANEIRRFKFLFESVASGLLIPFILLPPWAKTFFAALPFRYMLSAPLEILLGQVPFTQALQLLGIQVVWIGVLSGCLTVLWYRGVKRYVVPGQ